MHISNEQTERHRCLQRIDVLPRVRTSWSIEEHQEDACHREQDEQEETETAKAQRVADLDCMSLYLHRVQVVQHRVHDHVRTVTWAIRVSLTEN